jgi:hypothetical protein
MKNYIMVWNMGGPRLARQSILDVLDKMPEVPKYRAYNGCVLIQSPLDIETLTNKMHEQFPKAGIVFIHVNSLSNIRGWAEKDAWNFLGFEHNG